MVDRKSDNPLEEEATRTPETNTIRIRVRDLSHPDERPIELCAKLEKLRIPGRPFPDFIINCTPAYTPQVAYS